MPINKTHLTSLCLAAFMACALPTLAQDIQGLIAPEAEIADFTSVDNRYRIGIDCSPASEVLLSHLKLESGLVVNAVMVNSPAGRAGIKRFDVIAAANGQPVNTVGDLVKAVNEAKTDELSLKVIHRGDGKSIRVVPEERDEEEIERLRSGFANRLGGRVWPRDFPGQIDEEIERAMREMQRMRDLGPFQRGWRRLNPGIILDRNNSNSSSSTKSSRTLPDGSQLSIEIERQGNQPAQLKVTRGNDKWELTEDDLDQLPDDLKAIVERQLTGNFGFPGLRSGGRIGGGVGGSIGPRQPSSNKMEDRFDGLELKMQELQDAIRSIQESK